MTTVRMQWIGTPVLGLCLLLQGCAVGSSDLQYHLALDTDPAGQKSDCTVVLKSVVDDVLNGSSGPMGGSPWTIRDFQIKLERQLHQTVKGLTCNSNKKSPLNEGSVKWLASYAYEATDPDQELRRFEEHLNSRKLAQELIQKVPVVADERAGEQAVKNSLSTPEFYRSARLEPARSVWLAGLFCLSGSSGLSS